jgi:hypothetical protein
VIDREWRVRFAAFEWLKDLGAPEAELARDTLTRGFDLDGVRIPLLGPRGIWSPAGFRVPLSIATIPSGPYADHVDRATNRLRYAYRGTDPRIATTSACDARSSRRHRSFTSIARTRVTTSQRFRYAWSMTTRIP